jgi:hypothetical protein
MTFATIQSGSVTSFGTVAFAHCGFGKTKFESKVEETTTYNAGLDFDCTTVT